MEKKKDFSPISSIIQKGSKETTRSITKDKTILSVIPGGIKINNIITHKAHDATPSNMEDIGSSIIPSSSFVINIGCFFIITRNKLIKPKTTTANHTEEATTHSKNNRASAIMLIKNSLFPQSYLNQENLNKKLDLSNIKRIKL